MYTHICFVTSVRGMIFLPQIAANAGLRVFGAKMPTPFFFIARAFFFPAAFDAFLMYAHICFVTSVRGIVVLPQIAANAGLRVFGAKMPT